MILNLFIITIIVCYIVDLSGIVDSLKTPISYVISKYYKINISPENINIPKPFSCSKCMSFWICLIFIIVSNELTLFNLCLCTLMSFLSKNITGFMSLISETLVWIENKLFNILQN